MSIQSIYFDNNASTPIAPRVQTALLRGLADYGNPSSIHRPGQLARQHLWAARSQIAAYLGGTTDELLFTSGGTESINLMVRGFHAAHPGGHWITTAIEHSALYQTIQELAQKEKVSVTYIPCGLYGAPKPEAIKASIRHDTSALIFSAVNGETGVRIDLEQITQIALLHNIPLLIDAVAWIGKEPPPLYPGIAAYAISGHKFHAPKGIGALFCRTSLKLFPEITGGPQEYQKRAGTENLPGAIALAEAISILKEEQSMISTSLLQLRKRLEEGLFQSIPDLLLNGEGPRISNTVNISFTGVDGESLLMQLDRAHIAVSHGSACASGAIEPSRVLREMGMDRKRARSSLRFSLSRMNTESEVDLCIERTKEIVTALRALKGLSKNNLDRP